MKQYFGAILRFFKAVFFTFGLLIFLFCVRRYLPGFNGSQGVGLVELRLCLAMAVVFSMAHTIITSDRVPIRISLIATGILRATPHKLQSFRLAEVYQHILWITSAVLPAKAH